MDAGRTKHIGVSNHNIPKVKALLEHARIKPAVNQIEVGLRRMKPPPAPNPGAVILLTIERHGCAISGLMPASCIAEGRA